MDLGYHEGPDDGEDDFDEELNEFLQEMKTNLDDSYANKRENIPLLLKCMKEKLSEGNYCFNGEFENTGVLKILI